MHLLKILKYTGLLVFGYLLLLSLSYSVGGNSAYQPIITLMIGVFICFCVKVIRVLNNKYGATRVFLGILFIGGMIRFFWAIFIPTLPFSDFQVFHESAIKLSQGTTVLTKNMGYSLLLSTGYRIYPSVLTGKLLNATASTLSILFLYLLGSKLINQQAGLIASFLFVILPSEILMVSVLGTEVIATTLGIITAFFIFQTTDGKLKFSTSSIFWAGLFFGLGLTVRSSYIFFFPAILLWIIVITSSNYKQMVKISLSFFAGIMIGLSLILVSNTLSTKQFSIEPLKTQDSFPFLSGTNIETSGKFSRDDYDLYSSWDIEKRNTIVRQEAIRRIRSNPIEFTLLIPKKIALLMASNDYASWWSLSRLNWGNEYWLIGLISQSIYVFILFFAFCAFKYFDYNSLHLIVLILVMSTLLPHFVLEVQGRYHHYIMPFIALIASIGIQQIYNSGKQSVRAGQANAH
jgi:hypothetical protein